MLARSLALALGLALSGLTTIAGESEVSQDWPSFRGTQARGVAAGHPGPVRWDGEIGEGIAWKQPIPGMGHGSAVIWGNQVFVTTAAGKRKKPRLKIGLYGNIGAAKDRGVQRFEVYSLDKRSGEVQWKRTAYIGKPKIERHTKASHANSTPVTDGKRVIAFFGSEGLYAYDMQGTLLWRKDLGVLDAGFFRVPEAQWGTGSSPILVDDKVIVQCDVQGDSFVAAFDADTGEQLWRTAREEVPTWSTPTYHRGPERRQIILNGWHHIGGYDVATGKELWKMRGGGDIPVPTPIIWGELAFITNAHGAMAPVYAVRLDAEGDITLAEGASSNEGVAWSVERGGAYMQTPLVYGDQLYVCRDNGVLTAFAAATGERLYQQRLGNGSTGFTASSVALDGKIYFTSETGDVHVIKAGPEFEKIAVNPLGEICMATPAISEGRLFFRTQSHVVAVGQSYTTDEGATGGTD